MDENYETEGKLLDERYIEAVLQTIPDIRDGKVRTKVYHSNRIDSNSVYVAFYVFNAFYGSWERGKLLRISDHQQDIENLEQIIVNVEKRLLKKRKQKFHERLAKCAEMAQARVTYRLINTIKGAKVQK